MWPGDQRDERTISCLSGNYVIRNCKNFIDLLRLQIQFHSVVCLLTKKPSLNVLLAVYLDFIFKTFKTESFAHFHLA